MLRGRRRRAVDSTILADAVATQDTVTQLVSAVRRVAREVPGAAEQIAAVCTGHDYSKPGKPKIDWDDPAAKDALVSALVNDANALVDRVQGRGAGRAGGLGAGAAGPGRRAGRRARRGQRRDRDGRWRIAQKVAEDRVISTVDPDARHTRKSPEARRDGYRAHVAADPETGIITDEKLTRAVGRGELRPRGGGGVPGRRGRARPAPAPEDGPAPARAGKRGAGRVAGPAGSGGDGGTGRSRWPGTAIPPTAPGTCAARSPTPGTRR